MDNLLKIFNGVMNKKICFASVDVEDGEADHLDEILNIFKRYDILATLFVTGQVLEKFHDLAKDWARDYEIACHSFTHRFWNLINNEERKKELEAFVSLYFNIFQKKPEGFRAPSHIIDEKGIKLLEEKGFLYDSSVVPHYPPFKKYRGYKGPKPLLPHYVNGLKILEIPVSGQMFGIPLAGAWIRKLPGWFYKILFFIYCPQFITLSFHSWEKSEKFEEIIKLLKSKNYQFLNGAEIYQNYR